MNEFDSKCKNCSLVAPYPSVRLWFDGQLMVHYCLACRDSIIPNTQARFGGEIFEVTIPDSMMSLEWI